MATGPIRAAYFYSYMSQPNGSATDAAVNHVRQLGSVGINTLLVKFTTDTASSLEVSRWNDLRDSADAETMTIYPVLNYHNPYYLARFSNPDRRYYTTAGLTSNITTIACPNDPAYMRAMFLNGFQRFPSNGYLIIDPEFPGGPGGFHSYVRACYCPSCRLEWWRSVYCPGAACQLPSTHPLFDSLSTVLPDTNTYLLFQQQLHRTRVAQFAKQASWTTVGLFDNDDTDSFNYHMFLGLQDAGKNVKIFSEISYPPAGGTPTAGQSFTKAVARCSTTLNSPTLTYVPQWTNASSAFAGDVGFGSVVPGSTVTGTNIPANTTVLSVTDPWTLTLSNNATGTGSSLTMTFSAFDSTTQVGGIWLKYWNPTAGGASDFQSEVTNSMPVGYWIFTTYSLWLGQTAQTALAAGSDYKLYTGSTVQNWYDALATVNA